VVAVILALAVVAGLAVGGVALVRRRR